MRQLSVAACFLLLVTACGGDSQSDELAALREQVAALKEQPTTEAPATTTEAPATTTEAPATTTEVSAIPADVDLLTEIMVGDSFSLFDGFDILGSNESVGIYSTKLLEGDGSVCTLGGEYGLDVIGKALGTCLVGIRFSVGNSPDLGDVYFRVNVTEASATTEVSAIPIDVDLVTEIMVGDSFPLFDGFGTLGVGTMGSNESVGIYSTKLLEGDGSVCTLGGEYGLDVIGKALGTCLVGIRFSVGNSPDLRDVYFRVNVTEASATTEASAIPIDVDLVTEIMVGDSFDIALGALYVLGNSFPDGYSFPSNFLLEGDGSVCTFGGEYDLDVIGKALGTCLLKVTLLDLANGPEGSGEDVYIRINVIVPPPPPPTTTFAPLGDLGDVRALVDFIRRESIDVVHAHRGKDHWVAVMACRRAEREQSLLRSLQHCGIQIEFTRQRLKAAHRVRRLDRRPIHVQDSTDRSVILYEQPHHN